MKTWRDVSSRLAILVLATLAVACGDPAPAPDADATDPEPVGAIDGRLMTKADETYTAPCTVRVHPTEASYRNDDPPLAETTTVEGTFRLEDLPVGDVWMSIATTDPGINARYSAMHHVTSEAQTASFFMLEGARLFGRAVDASGNGTRAIIDLYDLYEPRGPGEPEPAWFRSIESDDTGAFAFDYVMPGKKFVLARRHGSDGPAAPPPLDDVSILAIEPNTDVDAGTLTVQ